MFRCTIDEQIHSYTLAYTLKIPIETPRCRMSWPIKVGYCAPDIAPQENQTFRMGCVITVGCISGAGRVKGQFVPVQAAKAYEGSSFPISALDKCERPNSSSGRFTPGERTPIPIE